MSKHPELNIAEPNRNKITPNSVYDILDYDSQTYPDLKADSTLEARIGLIVKCQDLLQPLVGIFGNDIEPPRYINQGRKVLGTKKVLDTSTQLMKTWRRTNVEQGVLRIFNAYGHYSDKDTPEITNLNMLVTNEDKRYVGMYTPSIDIEFDDNQVDSVRLKWFDGHHLGKEAMKRLVGGTTLENFLHTVSPSSDFGLDPLEQFPIHDVLFDVKHARLAPTTTVYGEAHEGAVPPERYGAPTSNSRYNFQLRPLTRDRSFQEGIAAAQEFCGVTIAERILAVEYIDSLESAAALMF